MWCCCVAAVDVEVVAAAATVHLAAIAVVAAAGDGGARAGLPNSPWRTFDGRETSTDGRAVAHKGQACKA